MGLYQEESVLFGSCNYSMYYSDWTFVFTFPRRRNFEFGTASSAVNHCSQSYKLGCI